MRSNPGIPRLSMRLRGGVGLMLTQMIKLLGGRVIGRVSSQDKVALAREAGADEVIVSRSGEFADEVLRLTGGNGVQVVYDGSGAETFQDSLRSLDYHGVLALFGPMMEPTPPVQIYTLPKSVLLSYPTVQDHVRTREAPGQQVRADFQMGSGREAEGSHWQALSSRRGSAGAYGSSIPCDNREVAADTVTISGVASRSLPAAPAALRESVPN
jgi:hypothetical protein